MSTIYSVANGLSIETSSVLTADLVSSLDQSLILAQQQLLQFVNGSEFSQQLAMAFGTGVNGDALQSSLRSGNYSILAGIEVRTGAELGGAKGAYGAETDKIYLSQDFLQANRNNHSALAAVLLEEAGHRIDALFNQIDSAGDEGAIFSKLVQNIPISDFQLAGLRAKDDHAIITFQNGQQIAVEKAGAFTGNLKKELTDNITGVLSKVQDFLSIDALKGVPLVGNKLSNALDSTFNDFKSQILTRLQALSDAPGTDIVAEARQALFDVLNGSLGLLKDGSDGGIDISLQDIDVVETADKVTFKLALGKGVNFQSDAVKQSIGLPALGLDLAGAVQSNLDFTWNLEFGVDTTVADPLDAFFVKTDRPDDLVLKLNSNLVDAAIKGKLGFLDLNAQDKASSLSGNFIVDLAGPVKSLTATPTFTGALALNLGLDASFGGSAKFPHIGTDFSLQWGFNSANKTPTGYLGSAPSVSFDNVTLDIGSFFKDLTQPILDQIETILAPIDPVLKVVDTKLPVFDDIGRSFLDKDKDGKVTLIDIAILQSSGGSVFIDFIGAAKELKSIATKIRSINEAGGTANERKLIRLGDFNLGDTNANLLDPTFKLSDFNIGTATTLGDTTKKIIRTADEIIQELGGLTINGKEVNSFSGFVSATAEGNKPKPNAPPSFPILTDPTQAFNLLLGKNAEFFKYTFPQLKFDAKFKAFFPIIGPLGAEIRGAFGASAQLAVGYDSSGIKQFANDNFQDPSKIFNGFYIDTTPEKTLIGNKSGAEAHATLGAYAAINLGVFDAGVGGGLFSDVNVKLKDANGDNKVYFNEIQFPCIFDPITGKVGVSLDAYIELDLGFFSITKRFDIAKKTLLDFSLGCNPSERAQIIAKGELATLLAGNALFLNMGDRAAFRILNDKAGVDDKEVFTVNYVSGTADNATLLIGYSDVVKTYKNASKIVANGGNDNDSIAVGDTVFTRAELRGGAGNDQIYGGSGYDSLYGDDNNDGLYGGAGDDQLFGGKGNDLLEGGKGSDNLDGGDNFDTVTYRNSAAGIKIVNEGGVLVGKLGEATGDRLVRIEHIEGSQHKDTIEGDALNNVLEGFAGDDVISAGSGDDVLIGAEGADDLNGGEGSDFVSYYSSEAGVEVNLATGKAKGGSAKGDKLTSIENLGGSAYADSLTGSDADNQLDGFFGDDLIQGAGGADKISGGAGIDTASYQNSGAAVNVNLKTGDGAGGDAQGDKLVKVFRKDPAQPNDPPVDSGYNSIENLIGSAFNDTLTGDIGNNKFDGLAGNDTMQGDAGDDTFVSGSGNDFMDGGNGIDTVTYLKSNAGVTVKFQGTGAGGDAQGDTFGLAAGISTVENIIGSRFADSLTADGSTNIITPGLSNGGVDVVDGGGTTEIDTMDVDYSQGDYGRGIIGGYDFGSSKTGSFTRLNKSGTANLDAINFTSTERLIVRGTFYNDVIYGGVNNDRLVTAEGDDLVYGGLGSNYISAGAGNDVVVDQTDSFDKFSTQPVNTFGMYLDGGRGIDTLSVDLSGKTAFGTTLKIPFGGEIPIQVPYFDDIYLVGLSFTEDPYQSLTLKDGTAITNFEIFKDIKTSGGNDVLTQIGRINNNFSTGFGDDTVNTGLGIDVADGGGEFPAQNVDINDGVRNDPYPETPPEKDLLIIDYSIEDNGTGIISDFTSGYADLGGKIYRNDVNGNLLDQITISRFEQFRIKGTSKDDQLVGGYYGDALTGNAGDDNINANEGDDVVNAGEGNDNVIAGEGDDIVNGGAGDDVIRDASIVFSDGRVFVNGGGGNDTFNGGTGNDAIIGGAGNDLLKGDEDNDTLIGANAGADQFRQTFGVEGIPSLADDLYNQIDTLTGGSGADEFWLGDNNSIYYDDRDYRTAGRTNYALITDFKSLDTDVVQLYGSPDGYITKVVDGNTEILRASRDGSVTELIAILQGVTDFDLGASYVRYVPAPQPPVINPGLVINNINVLQFNQVNQVQQGVAPLALLAPQALLFNADPNLLIAADLNSTRSYAPLAATPVANLLAAPAAKIAAPFTITSRIDEDPSKTNEDIVRDNFFGTTTGLSNFKVNLNGNSQSFGTFANDPFGLGAGLVLSTGKVADLAGANIVDGGFFTGTSTQLKFTKLPGQVFPVTFADGTVLGTGIFVADVSNLGFDLKSLTFSDSGSLFGGSGGYFTGFDLDGIRLSHQLITKAEDIGLATPLNVFDFSPAKTIFTPGTQRPSTNSVPNTNDLYGTINGYINNGVATLDEFDSRSAGLDNSPRIVSLGDNGKVGFNLTSPVPTDQQPLYLYVGEGDNNGETPDGLISASNREVSGFSDLSTDLGLPGVEDDTISMEIEFNADANTKNVYFQFAFGSEELLEYARQFNDAFTLELNGVNLATLRDGKEVTIDNLAVNSIGPYSPDLIINQVSDPTNTDVKLDGYTKLLTFTGAVEPNSVNKLVITIKDNRDGLLDSAVFLKAGSFGIEAPPSINTAPTGTPTAVLDSTPEDTDIIINDSDLLLGFTDSDGDALSIMNVVAKNGTLVDNGNNSYTFTPTLNFNGKVDLSYDVTDGLAPLTVQQQSFQVIAVNDAPTGSSTAVLSDTTKNNAIAINVTSLLNGFSDVDGDTLSIQNLTANNGSLVNQDGKFLFTPTTDFIGDVTLTYDVSDGNLALTGKTSIFKVIPINQPPTAITFSNIVTTIAENTVITNRLKVADINIADDGLGINSLSLSGSDASSFELDGNALYLKAGIVLNFEAKNSLRLIVNAEDDTVGSSPDAASPFTLNITDVNESPVGEPTAILANTPEDTAIVIKAIDLLQTFTDVDGNKLSIINLEATNGSLIDQKDGTYTFTPNTNFNGVVNLTYGVSDGSVVLAGQTRSFQVTPVNDAPVGAPTIKLVDSPEDTAVNIKAVDLLAGFSDVDGDTLSVINLSASDGIVVDNKNGTYTFTPRTNFNGNINLSYGVTDGSAILAGQTTSFKVTPINDAPMGTPNAKLVDTPENTTITIKLIDLLSGFSDVDGDKLSIKNLTATNGLLKNKDDGTGDYLFTPTTNFVGTVKLTYDVTDGIFDLPGQSLGFKILAVNKPPTAITFSNVLTTIAENTVLPNRVKVADINTADDGLGVNTLSLGGDDASRFELDGNILYLKAGTVLNYELKNSLNLVVSVDDVTVGSTPDATSPFSLKITDINESPTRKPIDSKLPDGAEDTPFTIKDSDLLAGYSDAEGDGTLAIKSLVANNGKLVDNKNGTYTFTPKTDYSGVANLTFDVTDGTSTLTGESNKFNIIATPPSFLAPLNNSSGLLQLSQGNGSTSLYFTKIAHQAGNRNELGVFAVDDDKGTINGILPDQKGYLAEVTKRSKIVFSSLSESGNDALLDAALTRTVDLAANSKIGFYLALDNSIDDVTPANVLFSFPVTTGGFQSAKTTNNARGVQLAFEDVPGGGDRDFNDLVVQIETVTTVAPIGITQQGSKEIFDLTAINTPLNAVFEIKRDAYYSNHVSFYKIEDVQGTIKVGTNLLKPGDSGYREAAVQGRITGVDLVGVNGQSVTSNAVIQGNALYAPILIANSAVANSNFSNVYTAYRLGNADLVDHVRLLGDNTFGFEDIYGGGDRDFNDVIVRATFKA
jgi:Ca2+-binding RTX toxin-like protein